MRSASVVLLLLLGLAACPTPAREPATAQVPVISAEPTVGAPPTERAQITSTQEPTPVDLLVVGAYVHAGSRIAFPERVAGFARSNVTRYDRETNDVGIHYRKVLVDVLAKFRAEVTVFVFPSSRRGDGAPLPLADQFEQEIAEIRAADLDVRELWRVGSEATFAGTPVNVRAAEFLFRGGPQLGGQETSTLIAAFLHEPWHVTCRATYPPQRRDLCLAAVESLLAELGLPLTGLPATTNAVGR